MGKKRLQLFIMYSFSIVTIISVFCVAIFYVVSQEAHDRIENEMKDNATSLINRLLNTDSITTASEISDFVRENRIDYVIWNNELDKGIDSSFEQLTLIEKPKILNNLEVILVQPPEPIADESVNNRRELYSYTILFESKSIYWHLQVLRDGRSTQSMIRNLASVLLIGGGIVAFLGAALGVILSYLNMMPVVKSWIQQRTFVADASHELRTPLSIITLKSDHLLTNPNDVVLQHIEDVAVIQQECRRMHRLVNDLLFLAKSDSGVMDVEIAEFSVEKLIQELNMLYSEFFEMSEKELQLDVRYTGNVVGDFERIKQVCVIIIDNALRFTNINNYVNIVVEGRANRIFFTISNNGIPLSTKEIPKIFNRFYKSDTSRNKSGEKDGNGLGLSIAREIINLHQSQIRASVRENITSFSFSLQRSRKEVLLDKPKK